MCSRLQRFFYTFHEISLIPHYREIRLFVLLMNIKRIQQPSNRIDRISFICVSHILFFFNFSRLSLVSPHYSNLIVWNDLIGKSSWKVFPMNVFSTIFVFLQRKILLFSFILSSLIKINQLARLLEVIVRLFYRDYIQSLAWRP